MSIVEDKAR